METVGVNLLQAILLGLCACLSSMPGMGGTVFGNYTLGRPLVAGLVVGLIMGDITTGIIIGAAIQVVYIALVTPGGTVSADVRAISYIGIPLAMVAIKGLGLDPASSEGQSMAIALGSMVGTLGTVLFYGTATVNLVHGRYYKELFADGRHRYENFIHRGKSASGGRSRDTLKAGRK